MTRCICASRRTGRRITRGSWPRGRSGAACARGGREDGMSERTKQALITLFFLGQLVAVWWLGGGPEYAVSLAREVAAWWENKEEQDEERNDEEKEQAIQRYGFYLAESAEEAGLAFRHQGPDKLD